MKTTATKLAKTRLNVPQILGLKRVSTDQQDTIRQAADLGRLEREFGVQVFETLEIEGVSGTATIKNADVMALLAKLNDPHVAGLGASSIDRLGRATRGEVFKLIDYFKDARKPIFSIREGKIEPWKPRDFQLMVRALVEGGAQLEEMRRLSMDQKLEYAKQNIITSSHAPYGYRYVAKRRAGKWVVFEPEAKVVREMFRRAAVFNWTGGQIAKWLNEVAKVPAPGGGKWCGDTVRAKFSNTVYIGRARFGHHVRNGRQHDPARERTIEVEPILKGDMAAWWDIVQVQLKSNQARRGGRPPSNFLLQKKIYCAARLADGSVCGHRVTGIRDKGVYRYKCTNRDRHTWTRLCSTSTRCEPFDTSIWDGLIGNLSDPDAIQKMLAAEHKKQLAQRPAGPSTEDRIAKLKRDMVALDRKLNDGDLADTWDATKKLYLAAKSELAVLEREAAKTGNVFCMPSRQSVASFARDIRDAGEAAEVADRRELVERFIVRIEYASGSAKVFGRFPIAGNAIKSGSQNSYDAMQDSSSFAPFTFSVKVAA